MIIMVTSAVRAIQWRSKNRKHFYDYVFMSPIYDSISKVNYYSTYTTQRIAEAQKSQNYQ